MESPFGRAPKVERERRKESSWHGIRAQLLALAVLAPAQALADEVQEQRSSIRIERVDENRQAFLERLDRAARTDPLENAWAHIVSPTGEEASYSTAVPGEQSEGSVLIDYVEMDRLLREGFTVSSCHTHPLREYSYIEGQARPLELPSNADIQNFIERAAVFATEKGGAVERLEDCVMTANGGYWTLRIGDKDIFARAAAAFELDRVEGMAAFAAFIRLQLENPRIQTLFGSDIPSDDGELVARALTLASGIDTYADTIPLAVRRFAYEVFSFNPDLGATSAHARLESSSYVLSDTQRSYKVGETDIGHFISFMRTEMGVELTWHEQARSE